MLSKISNYNAKCVGSQLGILEGYGSELHSADREWVTYLKNNADIDVFDQRAEFLDETNGTATKTFLLSLEGGILNCNQPLLNNTEMKLSFDRALASIGLIYSEYGTDVVQPTSMDGKMIDLIDPYLEAEYISSPYLRNFYAQIEDRPISLKYDDVNIYMRTINKDQSMIRVNNIMGGLTPDYLFAGFIRTDALNGDFNLSSSCFASIGQTDATITLNGMPVQGYPISDDPTAPIKFYNKFIDTIGKAKRPWLVIS